MAVMSCAEVVHKNTEAKKKSITITGEREDLRFKYDKMMIKCRNEL